MAAVTISISFRGTRRDVDTLNAAARLHGMSTGDFVRMLIEESPKAQETIGLIRPDFFAESGASPAATQ